LLRRREIDNGLLTLHQFRERLLIAMDTGVTKTASIYIISLVDYILESHAFIVICKVFKNIIFTQQEILKKF